MNDTLCISLFNKCSSNTLYMQDEKYSFEKNFHFQVCPTTYITNLSISNARWSQPRGLPPGPLCETLYELQREESFLLPSTRASSGTWLEMWVLSPTCFRWFLYSVVHRNFSVGNAWERARSYGQEQSKREIMKHYENFRKKIPWASARVIFDDNISKALKSSRLLVNAFQAIFKSRIFLLILMPWTKI